MGDAGSAGGQLRKALGTGSPRIALAAAAGMERIALDDALALAILLLRAGDRRAGRAAARAAGRFALEQRGVDADELALLVTGLARVGDGLPTPLGLRLALERRRLRGAIEQLDRHSDR